MVKSTGGAGREARGAVLSGGSQAAVGAVYSLGWKNPMGEREVAVGDSYVLVEMTPSGPDSIRWNSIRSLEPGTGNASRALEEIKKIADRYNVSITGSPQKFGKDGLSNRELRAWYGRHGFEHVSGGGIVYRPKAGA